MKHLILVAIVFALSGCAILGGAPDNITDECRISVLEGDGRYGSFTQYLKGQGLMVRIIQAGKGCPDYSVEKDGIKIRVKGWINDGDGVSN